MKLFRDAMFRRWWEEWILFIAGGFLAFGWVCVAYGLAIGCAEVMKWTFH